jgi:hypothetical protein
MAAPVSPCDSCGSPIPDSDLETGAAIILLSKRYCSGCKSEAMQSVSLDDLGPKAAPARAAAPPPQPRKPAPAAKAPSPSPAPPPKAAPPAPAKARTPEPSPVPKPAVEAKRPERKAAPARRPSTSAPAASRMPLVIGGIAAVILVIAGAVVVLRGKETPTDPDRQPTKGATGPAPTSPEDREAQARDAFAKVLDLANRTGVSWDLVLAAADKARPACRGTACEKKLEEIRTRAVQEKEAEEASREITPLLDELKGAVATDPEFKRYPELQTKFRIALETASKAGSVKRDEIRALQRDYNGRYEKLAEPHYTEINEAAMQLADERRFDDAIRKINTFPQHLRHSGAWMNLEKLKKDIERRKQK